MVVPRSGQGTLCIKKKISDIFHIVRRSYLLFLSDSLNRKLLLPPIGIVFATGTPKIGSFESRHVLGRENQIIRGSEPVKPFLEVLLSVEERR